MIRYVVVALTLAVVQAQHIAPAAAPDAPVTPPSRNDTRPQGIIGGTDAATGEFPYIAAVIRDGGHFCGGSLISPNYVLTAAHCFDDDKSTSGLTVRVGGTRLSGSNTGTLRSIAEIKIHPSYRGTLHDIALLRLASSISGTTTIDLAVAADVTNGKSCNVAGWGNTSPTGSAYPNSLKRVTVNVVSISSCNSGSSYDGEITNTYEICAGVSGGGRDACQGDSGGPLVAADASVSSKLVQIGVVSWGDVCGAANFPGIYARVSAYRSWVLSNSDYADTNTAVSASRTPTRTPSRTRTPSSSRAPSTPSRTPSHSRTPSRTPSPVPLVDTPRAQVVRVTDVTNSFQTVPLAQTYTSMVVACMAHLDSTSGANVIPRVRSASGNSFQLAARRASSSSATASVDPTDISCVVVEEGLYDSSAHGVQLEAVRFTSTSVNRKGDWRADRRPYTHPAGFSDPVVLAQVMTDNDPRFQVAFASGFDKDEPPSSDALRVGRAVGEDTSSRSSEEVGYIVFNAGAGTLPNGVNFRAVLTAANVEGLKAATVSYATTGLSSSLTRTAVACAAGYIGDDGGFPRTLSSSAVTNSRTIVTFDEDTIRDSERAHIAERVALVVFSSLGETDDVEVPSVTRSPTRTPSRSPSNTPSRTRTPTPSVTSAASASNTPSSSPLPPAVSASPSRTPAAVTSPSSSPSSSPPPPGDAAIGPQTVVVSGTYGSVEISQELQVDDTPASRRLLRELQEDTTVTLTGSYGDVAISSTVVVSPMEGGTRRRLVQEEEVVEKEPSLGDVLEEMSAKQLLEMVNEMVDREEAEAEEPLGVEALLGELMDVARRRRPHHRQRPQSSI